MHKKSFFNLFPSFRIVPFRIKKSKLLINFLFLSLFALSACSSYYQTNYQSQQLRVLSDEQPDTSLTRIISPYKSALDDEMNEVVGDFANDMSRGRPESTLGNFICDMLLKQGEKVYGDTIDFSVYNYGGIRLDQMNAGPVTRGKIFELLPFENFAVVVNLDASATSQLIQKVISENGWPVGGIQITVKNNLPEKILIHNMPFDTTRNYKIIMNDYMANGGDNLFFLAGQPAEFLGVTIRDLALQYIQNEYQAGRKIYSSVDGRIKYAE